MLMINLGRGVRRGMGCDSCGNVCGLGRIGDLDDEGNVIGGGTIMTGPSVNLNDPGLQMDGISQGGFGGGQGPYAPPSNSGFASALASGLTNLTKLFSTRLGVPQLNPGQSITVTPAGYQVTQQPAGFPATGASLGLGGGGSSLLPLVLIGAVVVFAMNRGK